MKLVKSLSLVALASAALAGNAMADGFECKVVDSDLSLKVYNHVDAASGTRNAAVMVLSDSSAPVGEKTIARFREVNGKLNSKGALYQAKVDLRFNDSNRKNADVLGTKLGAIDTITADIFFSFSRPLYDGEEVRGLLTILGRDGEKEYAHLDCVRYLKGE